MELSGRVIVVCPVVTGEGRNGTWRKQEYVIEHDPNSQYPKKMMFNLWGDTIEQFNIQVGQNIKVLFNIDAREYNGKWFNDLRGYRVEPAEVAVAAAAAAAAVGGVGGMVQTQFGAQPVPQRAATPGSPVAPFNIAEGDATSDLPF